MPAAKRHPNRKWILRGLVFLVLLGIVFVLGSLNVPFLQPDEPSEVILLYVLSTLVFLAFVIYGLVLIRYLARLYAERRRQVLGSQFKTKMVAGALALSLLPLLALFLLSYALVNRTLAKWFPRPLEIVRDDALYIVEHLLREHEDRARELAEILAVNDDLRNLLARGEVEGLRDILANLSRPRKLHWVAVLNASDQPIAIYAQPENHTDLLPHIPRLLEERTAFAYTISEEVAGSHFSFARVRIETLGGEWLGALIVAQPLAADLFAKAAEIRAESREYDTIARQRKTYRWQALLILLLITTLLLLATTWSALYLAKQVTIPIQALAVATEEVSRGNFDYRITTPARDELGTLVDSFNQMTAQLGASRRDLERAVTELEQRRQWMETIQESIPTGVVTLSRDLHLLSANAAAQKLLLRPASPEAKLLELLPPEAAEACADLFPQAAQAGLASDQVDFRLSDRISQVAVTVAALRRNGQSEGYVLVLDDLTDLLKAQKAEAWQEVAQRIAHEIKNPLTPILLSADRIRRYLERQQDADTVEAGRYHDLIAECARLIGQEVNSLNKLVDEFSRFARFPLVKPVPTQLNQIVESTLAFYRDKINGVQLRTQLAPDLPLIAADPDLLRRVVTNLVHNATEAVAQEERKDIEIRTRALTAKHAVELTVTDTGPGISPENKQRLFLPFFSTKSSGMGLGLAIVNRIVAEHHGNIRVEDNHPHGARFVVELPTERPSAG